MRAQSAQRRRRNEKSGKSKDAPMNLPSLDLTKVRTAYGGESDGGGVVQAKGMSGRGGGGGKKRGKNKSPREERLGFGEASRLHESGPRSVRGVASSGAQGTSPYARAPLTSRNTLATIGVEIKSGASPGARSVVKQKPSSGSFAGSDRSTRPGRVSSVASGVEGGCELGLRGDGCV